MQRALVLTPAQNKSDVEAHACNPAWGGVGEAEDQKLKFILVSIRTLKGPGLYETISKRKKKRRGDES